MVGIRAPSSPSPPREVLGLPLHHQGFINNAVLKPTGMALATPRRKPDVSGGIGVAAALEDALAHHQAGRSAQAEAVYTAILDAEPAEPTALYLSGLLHISAGRIDAAIARLLALVETKPFHVSSHVILAKLHIVRGEAVAAAACFKRVLTLDPENPEAQLGLAEALLATGQPGAALDAARQANRSLPGETRAQLALCRALLGAGHPKEALAVADTINPGAGDGWLLRGACLKALYRPEEAVPALRRAVALEPDRAAARLNLGSLCAEFGAFAEAEKELRQALGSDPACAEAHASLGSVLLLTGRIPDAELCFRTALAHDPDLIAAHQNLAAILTERRRHTEAQHHRQRAYRRQNLFVEKAPGTAPRVLLLASGGSGNVPLQFLLPRSRTTRMTWIVDHATPDQIAALPAYDLVFNTMGDPDLALGTDDTLAAFLADCTRPILNHPVRVGATRRDRLPALLDGIEGVEVPAVRRLHAGTTLAQAALGLPVLLRPAGSHGGQEILRVDRPEELAGLRISGPEDCYATAFHETRSPDGHYRKYRVIFVAGQPFFYHLAIGDSWLVHYATAGMAANPEKRREEAAFLADPAEALGSLAMAAVKAVGRRLGLDFGGADFALLQDGRILVFEANATMLVHPEAADGPFAAKSSTFETILLAFDDMIAKSVRPSLEPQRRLPDDGAHDPARPKL